jgi:hypothetical protein
MIMGVEIPIPPIAMDAAAPEGAPPRRIYYLRDRYSAPPCLEVLVHFSISWF